MTIIFTSNPVFSFLILHNLFTVATIDDIYLLKRSLTFQPYFFMFIILASYNFSSAPPVNTFSVNSLNINVVWNFILGPPCFSCNMFSLGDLIYFSGIQPPPKTFKMTSSGSIQPPTLSVLTPGLHSLEKIRERSSWSSTTLVVSRLIQAFSTAWLSFYFL